MRALGMFNRWLIDVLIVAVRVQPRVHVTRVMHALMMHYTLRVDVRQLIGVLVVRGGIGPRVSIGQVRGLRLCCARGVRVNVR